MTKHSPEPRVRLITYVSPAGKAKLEAIAAAEGLPASELVRRFISAGMLTHDISAIARAERPESTTSQADTPERGDTWAVSLSPPGE